MRLLFGADVGLCGEGPVSYVGLDAAKTEKCETANVNSAFSSRPLTQTSFYNPPQARVDETDFSTFFFFKLPKKKKINYIKAAAEKSETHQSANILKTASILTQKRGGNQGMEASVCV